MPPHIAPAAHGASPARATPDEAATPDGTAAPPPCPAGPLPRPRPRLRRGLSAPLICAGLALAAISLPDRAPAQAAGDGTPLLSPRVTAVELGRTGVARYTLSAPVTGSAFAFETPAAAADDVLASLIIRDPLGGVIDLTTETPGAPALALRGSPFDGGAPGDVAAMLHALKGERVTLVTADGEVSGRAVALHRVTVVEDGEQVERTGALLLDGDAARQVVLSPGVALKTTPGAVAALEAALEAERRGAAARRFALRLEGEGPRDVLLSWVTEGTAWKNSWRLLLDEKRLQGWAVVENVSGADWTDAALTLTAGAPQAWARDLLAPRRIARPSPPEARGFAMTAEDDAMAPKAESASRLRTQRLSAPMVAGLAPAPAPARASGAAQAAQAFETAGTLRYEMPRPVTLPAGRTANLMYLDLPIDPEIRGLHRPDAGGAPVLLAARIAADQALAPGIISVQDARGFVGDALFGGMEAGAARLLPFAAAPGGRVTRRAEMRTRVESVAFGDGLLTVRSVAITRDTYRAELPASVARFAVDHPALPGRRFEDSNGEMEHVGRVWRVTVPAADGRALAEITTRRETVERRRPDLREIAALLDLIRSAEGEAAPGIEDGLAAAKAEAEAMADAEARLSDLQQRRARLLEEQKRLRENLDAVTQAALRARYVEALDRTETEIVDTLDAVEAAQAARAEARAGMVEALRGL